MYQRILVPVDGSATAQKGLTEAIALARLGGGCIHLIHVVDLLPITVGGNGWDGYSTDVLSALREGGQAILECATQRVREAGVEATSVLREVIAGRICDVVLAEVDGWRADLIVIGTHGRRGVRRLLLGSDAEQILRSAPVPVLLVRGD